MCYKNKSLKNILTILTFLLIAVNLSAQKPNKNVGIIIGNVVDANSGKALADADLLLMQLADSSHRLKFTTDKNGSFAFEGIPFGYYRLMITATGFATLKLDSIYLREERFDFNLGDIKLNPKTNALEEVVVYAEKPLIENKDGNITYNVGESAMSNGATTAELLKNIPLVNNDPNGKILLKGKEPKILIDEKPVELNAQQLQDLLESLPGGMIERIEVMQNPPPQFANEEGGVINIVTRKGKIGFTGRINLSAGTRGEGSSSANIAYRNKKWSVNAHLGMNINQVKGNNYSRRENYYTDSTSYFNTDGLFENKNYRPNLRFQTDYELNKNHTFNFTYQGNLNAFDNNNTTQYGNINRFKELYKLSSRNTHSTGNGYAHSFSVAYNFKGKNPAEKLSIINTYSIGRNDNDRDFMQQFFDAALVNTGNDSSQQQLTDNKNSGFISRVNYDKPISKGITLNSGLTYAYNEYNNGLQTTFYNKSTGKWEDVDILSTNFNFNQQVSSVRLGGTYNITKSWRLNASLNTEFTTIRFNFSKGGTDVSNHYRNLLPSASLRKEFSKQFSTALVYRATIKRPGVNELNPAIDYVDPYNIRFGNPFLDASLSDNFDFNINYSKGKYYINSSLGYNVVKDVYRQIRNLVEGGTTQTSWQNISNRKEYEASVFGGYTFSKKFRVNASASYTWNQYQEIEKLLYKYQDGGSFTLGFNYNYMFSSVMSMDGNFRYNNFADPQGRSRSNLNMNFGIQRKFFDKRLTVSFNVIDPFTKQRYVTYTYGKNFFIETNNAVNTRNFRLSVSWQLNKLVQKNSASVIREKAGKYSRSNNSSSN